MNADNATDPRGSVTVNAREIVALRTVFPDASNHDLVDGVLAVKNEIALARADAGDGGMPWLGALGALVCAASSRHLSEADHNAAISEAHSHLFNVLRSFAWDSRS